MVYQDSGLVAVMTRDPESLLPCEETFYGGLAGHSKGGKMKKYNYNFIIHLLLNKYGWTQEEIGAWTWKKTNGS